MKKLIVVFLAAGSLCLAGCGEAKPAPETEPSTVEITVQTTEQPTTEEATTTKYYSPPEPLSYTEQDYYFDTFFAKTPTHFYCVKDSGPSSLPYTIIYAPVNQLHQQKEIKLPQLAEGYYYSGSIGISGISQQWLFVNCPYSDGLCDSGTALYRVSLETLEATEMYPGLFKMTRPWYNAASNSLLFEMRECGNDPMQLEAICLDTEERSEIYKDSIVNGVGGPYQGSVAGGGCYWHNTVDGRVVYEITHFNTDASLAKPPSFLVIDKGNNVTAKAREDISLEVERMNALEPNSKAERDLLARGINNYAVRNGYIYYTIGEGEERPFYKMKIDGTDDRLLDGNSRIYQLLAVKGQLLAMAHYPIENDWYVNSEDRMLLLDSNGKITKTLIARVGDTYYTHSLVRYGDMVMLRSFGYYNNSVGWFCALYDPTTGTIFPAT